MATETATKDDVKIVVLQRGWVFVGRFSQEGADCHLDEANCIRYWGTTRGLGEIAEGGPTDKTKLDPCPSVHFHELTAVLVMDCNGANWKLR